MRRPAASCRAAAVCTIRCPGMGRMRPRSTVLRRRRSSREKSMVRSRSCSRPATRSIPRRTRSRRRSCSETTRHAGRGSRSTSVAGVDRDGQTRMHPNDPKLKSFVTIAKDSHFPIQNLPDGVFTTPANYSPRIGVAIGDQVLDLSVLEQAGLLDVVPGERLFNRPTLNPFIERGPDAWRRAREAISDLLRHDNARLRDDSRARARAFAPQSAAKMLLPLTIPAYTDFYSSKEHATNVGSMFRDAAHALLPNWLYVPIAYNGRASSIVVSGTPVLRPNGQMKRPDAAQPDFGPCEKLDFELETAFVVGVGNALGEPVPVGSALSHVFGMVLMNDWSARDIQQWEYIPLGPFNSKSFATSISPWVVTMDALEP